MSYVLLYTTATRDHGLYRSPCTCQELPNVPKCKLPWRPLAPQPCAAALTPKPSHLKPKDRRCSTKYIFNDNLDYNLDSLITVFQACWDMLGGSLACCNYSSLTCITCLQQFWECTTYSQSGQSWTSSCGR